jgi:hypothetical protein
MRTVIAQLVRVLLVTAALGFVVVPLVITASAGTSPSATYADGFDWH